MHEALYLRDDIDYMCQEKEEEDSVALKIFWLVGFYGISTSLGYLMPSTF